jgi:hypothetical protein
MNPGIYRVRSERVLGMAALLFNGKDFCGNRSHLCHFLRLTSPEMGSAFRWASGEERALNILAPVADEVELIRIAG